MPLDDLPAGHLQFEEGHGLLFLDGDVGGDVGRKGGLAHPRPATEDNEIRLLESVGVLVDVVKPGLEPSHLPVGLPLDDFEDFREVAGRLPQILSLVGAGGQEGGFLSHGGHFHHRHGGIAYGLQGGP